MQAARKLKQPNPKPAKPVMRKPDSILVEQHFHDRHPPKKDQYRSPRAIAKIAAFYKFRSFLGIDFPGRAEIGMAEKPVRTIATLIATSQLPLNASVAEIVRNAGFEMKFVPDSELFVRINDPDEDTSGVYERAKTNLYVVTEGERTRNPDMIVRTAEALLNLGHAIDAALEEEQSNHYKQDFHNSRIREYASI